MKRIYCILLSVQFVIHIVNGQCNGAIDLCSKQYNKVSYLTTHNAFNSDEDGLLFPNQTYNIESQLNDGVIVISNVGSIENDSNVKVLDL